MIPNTVLITSVKDVLERCGFTLGDCFEPYTGHNLHPKKRARFHVPRHYYEINAKHVDSGVTARIDFRQDGCDYYVTTQAIGSSGSPYYGDDTTQLEKCLLESIESRMRYNALITH